MPSDSPPPGGRRPVGPVVTLGGSRPLAPPPRWAWLRSQGLGVCCGFGTVALLAVGSVVMAATRDGASAGIGLDDLTAFFLRPSPAHAWLYLLFPLAGLYAVNTALATWDNVLRRWQAGQRAPSAYAVALIHLAFLLGLVAHAAGGFLSRDGEPVLVASGWQALPGFGEVRLTALEVDSLPGGMPRRVRAALEVRGPGGPVEAAEVGFNQPLSGGLGSRLALLQDQGRAPVAHLALLGARQGEGRCALAQGQACQVAGESVELLGLGQAPGTGTPAALLRAAGPDGAPAERWVVAGELLALRGGRPLRLEAVEVEPAVLLRPRHAPGNPWALGAAVLLVAGTLLMWRRLIGR
jgi:hypothetical protein